MLLYSDDLEEVRARLLQATPRATPYFVHVSSQHTHPKATITLPRSVAAIDTEGRDWFQLVLIPPREQGEQGYDPRGFGTFIQLRLSNTSHVQTKLTLASLLPTLPVVVSTPPLPIPLLRWPSSDKGDIPSLLNLDHLLHHARKRIRAYSTDRLLPVAHTHEEQQWDTVGYAALATAVSRSNQFAQAKEAWLRCEEALDRKRLAYQAYDLWTIGHMAWQARPVCEREKQDPLMEGRLFTSTFAPTHVLIPMRYEQRDVSFPAPGWLSAPPHLWALDALAWLRERHEANMRTVCRTRPPSNVLDTMKPLVQELLAREPFSMELIVRRPAHAVEPIVEMEALIEAMPPCARRMHAHATETDPHVKHLTHTPRLEYFHYMMANGITAEQLREVQRPAWLARKPANEADKYLQSILQTDIQSTAKFLRRPTYQGPTSCFKYCMRGWCPFGQNVSASRSLCQHERQKKTGNADDTRHAGSPLEYTQSLRRELNAIGDAMQE